MGKKIENALTSEPIQMYPLEQTGNQFGRFGTDSDTPNIPIIMYT